MPWVVQGIVPAYQLAMGFPGGSDGNETACKAGNLGQEDPMEKKMATHSSILAWEILWSERSLAVYSPWGYKESDTTEQPHQQLVTHGTNTADLKAIAELRANTQSTVFFRQLTLKCS